MNQKECEIWKKMVEEINKSMQLEAAAKVLVFQRNKK